MTSPVSKSERENDRPVKNIQKKKKIPISFEYVPDTFQSNYPESGCFLFLFLCAHSEGNDVLEKIARFGFVKSTDVLYNMQHFFSCVICF